MKLDFSENSSRFEMQNNSLSCYSYIFNFHKLIPRRALRRAIIQCTTLGCFAAPGNFFLPNKMQNNLPLILPLPGIEKAVSAFTDHPENIESTIHTLDFAYNSFVGSEDFELLDRIERTNMSTDFQLLREFLYSLKAIVQQPTYLLTSSGITERRIAS